ncbi:MAG: excinuclease ABC subunit C [Methanocalculus sp. MSAO_Arc1]|uniref:excinuclease ABC subunit UvrC n=1 Tax=Methanocalculus TaxID=71151 RepID=UPI000FED72A5|nr:MULTISPECIES: excinuclease ABC subunit UvrC [unclassified Methanocalculus]MCP1662499.1 excinuclease ABC subunit C [Methanocalculus sp. AMF5]RQD80839.1 MAG: excinuclease ABC subunit C [Methanocalculus sp. MSAO_Arc1]
MIDAASIPELPGSYLFRDGEERVIYVGKAKNLRKRVQSYFSKKTTDPKTAVLVDAIRSVDFIATDDETEALILENTLIKQYQPKYNIDLKDAKSYAFIHLSDDPYPRIGIARRTGQDGRYFGPFVSGRERNSLLAMVKKTFGIRSCRRLPKRPCLRYHIGTCKAPCTGTVTEEEYQERVRQAELVLKGKATHLIAELKQEMERLSSGCDYESAIAVRDTITALENLSGRRMTARKHASDGDVIHYRRSGGEVFLLLFHQRNGTLMGKEEYRFDESPEFLSEFLVQYYSDHDVPAEVIIPEPVDDAITGYLRSIRGKNVDLTIPKQGAKRELLDLAGKNVDLTWFSGEERVHALQRTLRLHTLPWTIEGFDISHLQGTAAVGAMVRFTGGRPDKRSYRRFSLKTADGGDDPGAIREVVRRRYSRLIREGRDLPDLVVIDGGKAQLYAAEAELQKLGSAIPVIAIAKREEEIWMPKIPYPLPITPDSPESLLIQEIRDEAHRFALSYNRILRRKKVIP